MRAWIIRPESTVNIYMKSIFAVSARSRISKILPIIKQRMPMGEYLN